MNYVLQGDCRDSMRKLIAEGLRVQCIVTSPPYWGLRDYGCDGQIGLEPTLLQFIANLVEVFELCRELLADDGTLWLNMGDSYAGTGNGMQGKHGQRFDRTQAPRPPRRGITNQFKPKDLCGQPWRLAFALQDAGWWLRQDIIWAKPNPMPESVTDRCTKSHEYLFLLTKSERYYYDADAIKEQASSATVQRLSQKSLDTQSGSTRAVGKHNGNMKAVGDIEFRNRRSVWSVPTEAFSGAHFAVMPEALVEPCVLAGSRSGDIVFDPFLGSGTVAQVAQRLGRRWIGCELNPEYVQLIHQRTQQMGMAL